jgi:RimJ/RimL family protein N-acetyltransferase
MEHKEEITVWTYSPYDRRWPDDTLVRIFCWFQEDRISPMFWQDGMAPSFNTFIRMLTDPGRVVFFPMLHTEVMTLDSIIGMVWVDAIEFPHAEVHFWVRKKHWWKQRPLHAARKVLALIFAESPALQLLICRPNSHNTIGMKFMKKLGVRIVGEIPNWYCHGEVYHPMTLGYIPREDIFPVSVYLENVCQHTAA